MYRLAYWRVASPEINYRRFFDVSDLVAMRVEDERVFVATHARVLELVAADTSPACGSTTSTAWPIRSRICSGFRRH